jgi:hypothetical protein
MSVFAKIAGTMSAMSGATDLVYMASDGEGGSMVPFFSWRSVPDDGQWHEWGNRMVCRVGDHFIQIEGSGNVWMVQFGRKTRTLEGAKRAALAAAVRRGHAEVKKLQSMLQEAQQRT